MAKKIKVKVASTNKVPATPVNKARKVKVSSVGSTAPMPKAPALVGANPAAAPFQAQALLGDNIAQQMDAVEQSQLTNSDRNNAYADDIGYFNVPLNAEGKYAQTGEEVAKKIRMKKGAKK